MSRSEKRTSRAGPKPGAGAGGTRGDDIRDNLRRLVGQHGSQTALARVCGIDKERVSEWLSGKQLPGVEHLLAVADGTGVSLDWLLTERGGSDPVKRDSTRTRGELAADLAQEVEQALREATGRGDVAALPPSVLGTVARRLGWSPKDAPGESWTVNGARLLAIFLQRAGADADAMARAIARRRKEHARDLVILDAIAAKQAATGGELPETDRNLITAVLGKLRASEERDEDVARAAAPEADYLSVRRLGAAPPTSETRGGLAAITGAPAPR